MWDESDTVVLHVQLLHCPPEEVLKHNLDKQNFLTAILLPKIWRDTIQARFREIRTCNSRGCTERKCGRNIWIPLLLLLLLLFLSGIYNPLGVWAASLWSSWDHTQGGTTVGRTSDQLIAETFTWQHTQHSQRTTIHAPGGIQTRNPRKRSAIDMHLRPLGHWDWL